MSRAHFCPLALSARVITRRHWVQCKFVPMPERERERESHEVQTVRHACLHDVAIDP
jgi:hypothetical protein